MKESDLLSLNYLELFALKKRAQNGDKQAIAWLAIRDRLLARQARSEYWQDSRRKNGK